MDLKLNTLADRPDLYREIYEYDLIEKIEPLLRQGFRIRREDGKVATTFSFIWDTPWITVYRDLDRECLLWHQVLFRLIKAMPSFCMNCWKVVARPNNFDQFAKLHDLMVTWNRSCKIGIEVRAYVQSLYGAYFYNNSFEAGQNCLTFVKEQVHSKISPDIDVHLKRYCTEFELEFGPSNQFKQRESDKIWEQIVHEHFALDILEDVIDQPQIVKQHIVRKIMEYAAKMKDPTVQSYNGGKPLMPHIVKYGPQSRDPSIE